MKYLAKVSGKKLDWAEVVHPLSVKPMEAAAGKEETAKWQFERRPGGWIIATQKNSAERVRFHYTRAKQQFWAKINVVSNANLGSSPKNEVLDATLTNHLDVYGERLPVNRAGTKGDAGSDFVAQFPGKVRKIMVAAGDVVVEGAPLLMIEAMKMEFAIKATQNGVVKKVLVAENQQLTPGQKLLDFEVK
jgi:biotin carboxyl carrier protein